MTVRAEDRAVSRVTVVATIALVVVLAVAGALVWRTVGPDRSYSVSTDHGVAGQPAQADRAEQVDPTAAARALAGLVSAVRDRNTDAAAALAPTTDAAARSLLQAVVTNATSLDVVGFTARYVDQEGAVGADGSWTADVDLSWRFAGFDQGSTSEEVRVAFDGPSGAVAITGFGGGSDRSPLWLSGPLVVRRTNHVLVLATTAADADLVEPRATQAVTVVNRVLPRWPGRLVVEVPASEAQLDGVLGANEGTYTAIAAVTASVDGQTTAGSPVHEFINPSLYRTLDPVGAQVVLSHETTHLATDAPLIAGLPSWLVEGFADYVALRDVRLPLSTTAGQIIAQVKASGAPDHLPSSTDFDEHATHLGATYEAAWLVCRVLADTGGENALVRLYEQVGAGQPLSRELQTRFGLTEKQLLARWQQRLRQLATTTSAAPGTTFEAPAS